jgi:hypothetical protein
MLSISNALLILTRGERTNEINAGLAAKRAAEKRAYAERLEKDAAEIEANIAREIEKDEYKNLAGQEKYVIVAL